MKQRSPTSQFLRSLRPRYWLTWLGLSLLWLLIHLPYPLLVKLGIPLGALLYRLAPKRRHITQTNLALAFPELDQTERDQLCRRVFRSVGISFLETPLAWWGSDKRLAGLSHIEGLEHLQAALAEGHGVILLTAHFTCLELGARLLAPQQPLSVLYKRQRNLPLEIITRHNIKRHFHAAIQRHDVRSLLRALKKNQACWYAPDQDFGPRQSLFAPFMGVSAASLESPMRLAKVSDARVVPFFPLRREDGLGYQLTILPALENFPSGDSADDLLADATRINALFEAQIRRAPEQYLWLHRRFKTRPEGEPGLYGWADKKRRHRAAAQGPHNKEGAT